MKLWEICRFEFAYQARQVSTWLYAPVLGVFAFVQPTAEYLASARNGAHVLGAPFVVAEVTVTGCLVWLLVAAFVAGDAAARDAETGMDALTYTAPVRKADHLGGRFAAAFTLNALVLLAVPVGIGLGVYATGVDAGVRGPFRAATYLTAYGTIALPNAFVGTAVQFSVSALGRRAIAGYLGGLLLLSVALAFLESDVGRLLDPVGIAGLGGGALTSGWTPGELNTRLIALDGTWLLNRLVWLGVALGALAVTHSRFRFRHHAASPQRRWARRRGPHEPTPAGPRIERSALVSAPDVRPTFGLRTRVRQTLAVAWVSFASLLKSRVGLLLLALVAVLAALSVTEPLTHLGVPLRPRTDYVLHALTVPDIGPAPWVIIPLLIVFWSGELVWRDREAGLDALVDAAPVPEWVLFGGTFLGLGLVLAACMALRMAAGMLVQAGAGYAEFEVGLYLLVLFGLQLPGYLLLALLALVVHVAVDHKAVGHLVTVVAFVLIAVAPVLGVGHDLLVYGSGPGWSYTDMRGFGGSLGPWLWSTLYWAAWALLLAVGARVLWVRGRETGFKFRLQLARRRLTRPTARVAGAAAGLVLVLGGFIAYHTNVPNEHQTVADRMERAAEYERRYARYEGVPQPRLTATRLHVEIYPERRAAQIRGTYRLVNPGAVPIDTVHVTTVSDVETGEVAFSRPAALVLADDDLGHRIYALSEPLQPGDSLRMDFEVHVEPRGFRRRGVLPADASVAGNGTWFTNRDWLPALGYDPEREIQAEGERRARGLSPRPPLPSLHEGARQPQTGAERIDFEAVVGTDGDQIAVAPGSLQRTWTDGGRRYFHYVADAPIQNSYSFFSADYAVHEDVWNGPDGSRRAVAIQIVHHPGHAENLDRMVRSVRASLDYYTEQFGPYPHRQIRLVERPGHGVGLSAETVNTAYQEGFSRLNPDEYPRGFDFTSAILAHEVARQWWGLHVTPTSAEGSAPLTESLEWYSALRAVEAAHGPQHLRRLLRAMRWEPYPYAPVYAAAPPLRAAGPYPAYLRGPFALYPLSEYVGEERVNGALRRLVERPGPGAFPLPTSLDLYRELRAVTPDSLRYLLVDLFERNAYWKLQTKAATAEPTGTGAWRVTLDVRARKVVIDEAGVEAEVPMDEWVEVGVYAADDGTSEPQYLRQHRVRTGRQAISVTVPRVPSRAGVDPRRLLIDTEGDDNTVDVGLGR